MLVVGMYMDNRARIPIGSPLLEAIQPEEDAVGIPEVATVVRRAKLRRLAWRTALGALAIIVFVVQLLAYDWDEMSWWRYLLILISSIFAIAGGSFVLRAPYHFLLAATCYVKSGTPEESAETFLEGLLYDRPEDAYLLLGSRLRSVIGDLPKTAILAERMRNAVTSLASEQDIPGHVALKSSVGSNPDLEIDQIGASRQYMNVCRVTVRFRVTSTYCDSSDGLYNDFAYPAHPLLVLLLKRSKKNRWYVVGLRFDRRLSPTIQRGFLWANPYLRTSNRINKRLGEVQESLEWLLLADEVRLMSSARERALKAAESAISRIAAVLANHASHDTEKLFGNSRPEPLLFWWDEDLPRPDMGTRLAPLPTPLISSYRHMVEARSRLTRTDAAGVADRNRHIRSAISDVANYRASFLGFEGVENVESKG